MGYFCGIDIGGTFTDCVVLDDVGRITLAKVSSTPPNFAEGFLNAIDTVAGRLGLETGNFLGQTDLLLHGTTVGTNVLVQMKGARTGLITTAGHGDALIIMRSAGRSAGLTIDELLHVSRHKKPEPIVPRTRIKEVSQRMDWAGDILLELNEDEVRAAISELVADGIDAIAVSFLWGFVNSSHELRVKALIEELAPGVLVSCAHELIAKPGEYERTAAAAINAFIGPATSSYIQQVDRVTTERGYENPLLIMQASGGVVHAEQAARHPLFTIASGPVGGVAGAAYLAERMGHDNVIACDMGGTSFDVGIIVDGDPVTSSETVINQYTFFMPRVDIESIGSGGGSLLWVDEHSGTMRVGPQSAGALPGPVSYGRGGTQATVTDCDAVLGRYNPDNFLGGELELDRAGALAAVEQVSSQIGLEPIAAADGALRIVESQMADLMRQMTVERGRDPRDFVIYAFGGAGAAHAVAFARELGAAQVVIPLGDLASTWSALGVMTSDVLHIRERSEVMIAPFSADPMNAIYAEMEESARAQLHDEGFADEDIELTRLAEMKFSLQIHQVEVPVPSGTLTDADAEAQADRFIERYQQIYGKGSAFVGAGTSIGLFKVLARGRVRTPVPPPIERTDTAPVGTRDVYWRDFSAFTPTSIYHGAKLSPAAAVEGPAIIEFPDTTVVVPPGASARLDELGSVLIDVGTDAAGTGAGAAPARVPAPSEPPSRTPRRTPMATGVDTEIKWDGSVYPYIAPDELDIHPSLELHTEADETVDPVTHEVLRHALWNVNVEHGQSIIRTSGSPICAYGHDFNPAILDEEGGYVFFGKYNLYLAVSSAAAVKWTLEYRSEDPGIHEGDMFLTNDPWIGTTHQPDVVIACPVFVDGKLFCWVSNTLHQWDLGGTAPGGFNPMAEDCFWEVPCYPPVKIVEDGAIRRDIEELYTRNSRLPDLVALDLRSQVTGCNVARDRVLSLVERYGATTVKATMRKVQSDSAAAFSKRLETIPDGTWTEEGWMEVKLPGDRGLYRNRVRLTKRDGKLIFSNEGSADQQGALNACLAAWKGAVISMLASTMLFDQMFALEGAMRNIEFEVVPGTISCAIRPAAVSGGPPTTLLHSIGMAGLVISKMLFGSSDERLREEVMSCMGVLGYPVNAISGVDQRGRDYVSFLNDPVGAALAALPWRDGQDTGGWPWDLQSTIPNVEDNELFYPLIYLWRREVANSGGAGKFRGGNGCEGAVLSHKTDRINWVTVGAEVAVPGPGLFGGYPTSTNLFRLIKGADVHGFMERTGTTPSLPEQLSGETDWVPAKSFDRFTDRDDLWIFSWAGAGGYGDPVERDPEMTRDDVRLGRVTADWAQDAYGVVLTGEGDALAVDEAATTQRREEIVAARLAEGRPWTGRAQAEGDGDGTVPPDGAVSEYVAVRDGRYVSGDVDLGEASGNYKDGALIRDRPLAEGNPNLLDPALFTDNDVRFREIICPETGRLLQTEIVVDGAPPQWDLRPGQF